MSPSGTPSNKSTTPVSREYSAPTTIRPSSWMSCSRTREPWRRWSAEARMLARTAARASASRSFRSSVSNSPSTDGRTRSTIASRLRDALPSGFSSASIVAWMAPHCVWPSTTTRRVPMRSAANSTLPTPEGATMLPATRITNRSPSPQSKMISAGTRASEQPRMMANGSVALESFGRVAPCISASPVMLPVKRRFPSLSRLNASRALSFGISRPCCGVGRRSWLSYAR
jgi:hypothetical protein